MSIKQSITIPIAVLALVVPAVASAATRDFGLAIDKAGRQRMLTQRIVKTYTQIGLEVQEVTSREQLRSALDVFDDQLAYLRDVSPNEDISGGLEKVGRLWQPFKEIALRPINREGANKLAAMDGDLLAAAHEVVNQFVSASGATTSRLVNLAGRQRMLLQRMAKFYMLRTWKFNDPKLSAGIEQAVADFKDALGALKSASVNTPAIDKRLGAAAAPWRELVAVLTDDRQSQPLLVATSSEKLLDTFDEITTMYAALVR